MYRDVPVPVQIESMHISSVKRRVFVCTIRDRSRFGVRRSCTGTCRCPCRCLPSASSSGRSPSRSKSSARSNPNLHSSLTDLPEPSPGSSKRDTKRGGVRVRGWLTMLQCGGECLDTASPHTNPQRPGKRLFQGDPRSGLDHPRGPTHILSHTKCLQVVLHKSIPTQIRQRILCDY